MNAAVFCMAVLAIAWHAVFLRPLVGAAKRTHVPLPVHLTILGIALYMDVGLLLEGLGVPYSAVGFRAFVDMPLHAQLTVLLLLLCAPLLLTLGAHLARGRARTRPLWPRTVLNPTQEVVIVSTALVAGTAGVLLSLWAIRSGGNLPGGRLVLSRTLGPAVLLLYVPMGLAVYYASTGNARSSIARRALALAIGLVAGAATVGLAQRTLLLLPTLVVVLCLLRLTPLRLIAGGVAGLIAVSALGIVTKPAGVASADRPSLLATINESVARGPVLARAVEESELLGTSVMAYPGEGYVYSALFFVPREVVPFKGAATAQRFTDRLQGEDRYGRWGFGLGILEEGILNVGLMPVGIVLLAWGYILGGLEAPMWRRPYVVAPIALGSLWLGAYHLPAVLLLFGTMGFVALLTALVMDRLTWRLMPIEQLLAPYRLSSKPDRATGPKRTDHSIHPRKGGAAR